MNGTHQLVVYADDVNIWGKNINNIKQTLKLCYRLAGRLA